MMSPEVIRDLADDAARKAARLNKRPYAIFDEAELARFAKQGKLPFPFIGSYLPPGYEKCGEWFVDASGFGAEDEPAMTRRAVFVELEEHMKQGNLYCYAITEAGQFQVYIGIFRKVSK